MTLNQITIPCKRADTPRLTPSVRIALEEGARVVRYAHRLP